MKRGSAASAEGAGEVIAIGRELLTHRILHADETPVAMLKPGKGKTHRAYIWSYWTTSFDPVKAVVFDFTESRGGEHARDFLGIDTDIAGSGWHGTLVCDDYSGYKAAFAHGLIEAGCLAHALILPRHDRTRTIRNVACARPERLAVDAA